MARNQKAFGSRASRRRRAQCEPDVKLLAKAARIATEECESLDSDKQKEEELFGLLAKAAFGVNDHYHRGRIKRDMTDMGRHADEVSPGSWPEWYVLFTREIIRLQPELADALTPNTGQVLAETDT